MRSRSLLFLFLALTLSAVGCDRGREIDIPVEELGDSAPTKRVALPDALLIRFQETRGIGFAREGWEMEILQMGSEVHLRGSVRSEGASVPVYRLIGPDEFEEIWSWVREVPFDGYRVREDETAPPAEWTKSLDLDVVLGPERRDRCRTSWSRPPVSPPDWLESLETRLHLMLLNLAEAELERMKSEPSPRQIPPEQNPTVRRAMESLGDPSLDDE